MGRGRAWDSKENLHVCQAYCQATNHYHATQRDNNCHKSDSFWNDVTTRFHGLAPPDSTRGTYSDRSLSSVKCHLLHKVFPDCNKFSKVLRKVTAEENLTGNLSPKQLYNIAVAFHLDKTKKPDCDYKRFKSDENWANSLAYRKILRFEPKWRSTDETIQQPSGFRSNVSDDDYDAATESLTEEDAACGNHNRNDDDDDSSDTSSDFTDHNCTGTAAVPRRLSASFRKSSKRVRGEEDEGDDRDKTRNKIDRGARYDALEKMVSVMEEQCRLMARKSRISELKLLMSLAKKRGNNELVKKCKVELMTMLQTALQRFKFAPEKENGTNKKKDVSLAVIDLSKGEDDNVNDEKTSTNPLPPLKKTTVPKTTPADPKKKAPVSNNLLWSNFRAPGTVQPQPYMTYPFYTSAADFRAPGFMQSQPYMTHPLYALAAGAPGALQPQSYMANPLDSLAAASALKGPTPD